jgi:6-phosphogluconolactonase (cycloisomerase 2 family)
MNKSTDVFELKSHVYLSNSISTYIDEDFIIVGTSNSIRTYTYNTSGSVTFVDSQSISGGCYKIVRDGNYIITACFSGGIRLYTIDASGNLTFQDSDNISNGTYWSLWTDSSYIYCVGQLNSRGIITYSIDGSDNLVYESRLDINLTYTDIVGDSGYLYTTVYTSGGQVCSYDGSGTVSYESAVSDGGSYVEVCLAGNFVIFASSNYLLSYSKSSGALTLEDNSITGSYSCVTYENSKIFTSKSDTVDKIQSYSIDINGDLTLIHSQDIPETSSSFTAIEAYGDFISCVDNGSGLYLYKYNG